MSTKIWTAYRIKPHVAKNPVKFWQWVRQTIERGEKEVQKVLRNLYAETAAKVDTNSEEFQKKLLSWVNPEKAKITLAHDLITREYAFQVTRMDRNLFDFDVNIPIRELDGNLYVIPHCDMLMKHTLDFLKRDPCLEDFAYWNNVDPPNGMRKGNGYKRWCARGLVWDRLDANWQQYLLVIICDYSKFSYITPWLDLMQPHNKPKNLTEARG